MAGLFACQVYVDSHDLHRAQVRRFKTQSNTLAAVCLDVLLHKLSVVHADTAALKEMVVGRMEAAIARSSSKKVLPWGCWGPAASALKFVEAGPNQRKSLTRLGWHLAPAQKAR